MNQDPEEAEDIQALARGMDGFMTRYFYTHPLAAAWMAEYFGMRFQVERSCGALDSITAGMEHLVQRVNGRFHVHPDSLQLLYAQRGDLATLIESDDIRIAGWVLATENPDAGQVGVENYTQGSASSFQYCRRSNLRVIQRNGIPFMWPDQEAT